MRRGIYGERGSWKEVYVEGEIDRRRDTWRENQMEGGTVGRRFTSS